MDHSEPVQAPLAVEAVTLVVHDLDDVAAFYRDVVGLAELSSDGERRSLGVGNRTLIELRRDRHAAERSARDAGLFHTAFLLPERADLGRWLRHASEMRLALHGASDHVVSEAVYLADPEGNGVEIYADRPRAAWTWTDGTVTMRTDRLDTGDLLASAGSQPWRGAPAETTVGHVHLQVGTLAAADAFYGGVLGLDVTARYPGATFFACGGYHHHIATNVWNSRGAPARTEPTTGLAAVGFKIRDPSLIAALGAKTDAGSCRSEKRDGALTLHDPWNTALTFTAGSFPT